VGAHVIGVASEMDQGVVARALGVDSKQLACLIREELGSEN
jgi:hypothetical protein